MYSHEKQLYRAKKESLEVKLNALDDKLERFAKKHNTSVRSPNSTYYNSANNAPVYNSLENREISWIDGSIAKAITVMPYSTNSGFSPNTWDVCTLAWFYDSPIFEKPHWVLYLLKNADIKTLEQNIDQLLMQAEEKLANIKPADLK